MQRSTLFQSASSAQTPPKDDLFATEWSKPKQEFIERKYQEKLPGMKEAVEKMYPEILRDGDPKTAFQQLNFVMLDYDTQILGHGIGNSALQDTLKVIESEINKFLQYREAAEKQWQELLTLENAKKKSWGHQRVANSTDDSSDEDDKEREDINIKTEKMRSELDKKQQALCYVISTALNTIDQATADKKSDIVAEAYKQQLILQRSINEPASPSKQSKPQ